VKILICADQLVWGGAEFLACRAAIGLNGLPGWEVHLASRMSANAEQQAAARMLRESGVPQIHWLNFDGLRFLPTALVRLKGLLRRHGFQAVETSSTAGDILVGWALKKQGAVHIKGIHDYFAPEVLRRPVMRVWRKSLHARQAFYAVSHYAKKRWAETLGVSAQRIRVIYNGLPFDEPPSKERRLALSAEVRQELRIPVEGRILLSVGRLLPRKGQDLALRIAAPLLKSENAWLVFAGAEASGGELAESGAKGFFTRFNREISASGVAERVRLLGRRTDVRRLMLAADVLLHPARHEAFGMVLPEAFAAGLLVAASAVGGIPEVLGDSPYAPLSLQNEARFQVELMRLLRLSPEATQVLREAGEKRLKAFSEQRRWREMADFFQESTENARRE
jgi:glycosyltransferase involved in cell wall biosynthesis